jgi:CTP:molybdopterin cytidylyltransferase MocA
MWLFHGSIQESLDLHFLSAEAMGFVPVELGNSYAASLHTHSGNAFELSPSARPELASQPHDVVDVAADGNHLDISDLSDYLEVHRIFLKARP